MTISELKQLKESEDKVEFVLPGDDALDDLKARRLVTTDVKLWNPGNSNSPPAVWVFYESINE